MAKKTVKSEYACPPSVGDYKPRLYLDLEGKDIKQIEGLSVGETAEFLVTGKVVGLEQRERSDSHDGKTEIKKTGSISLEGYHVKLLEDEKETNEFKKLAEEDES